MSFVNQSADILHDLPEEYKPGPFDVVIGKGKKFYFHEGNDRLRKLARENWLDEYKKAVTKPDKSFIISEVVEEVRRNGRFVKKDNVTGKWVYAEELLCREKCSQTFRDALHETYRSSNVAKKNKRRREQQLKVMAEKKMQETEVKRHCSTSVQQLPSLPADLFAMGTTTPSSVSKPMATKTASIPKKSGPPSGQDIIAILSDVLSLSSLDDEDDNPFEPKPLPPNNSFQRQENLPFDTNVDPFVSSDLMPMGLFPNTPNVSTMNNEMSSSRMMQFSTGFWKDDQCQFETRPLRGPPGFEQYLVSLKGGDDSFDELSTISDLEALRASNEESYDLGPNIHAAFAA